ncbi:MAG TPA: Spy/CpxP family protein refolding chaperone [Thermodesulfobacteriota bacterium]|nr:Spy/CpxP family protein refolding chaperone [Thermodesulfobacteriota bacterium]
MNRLFICAFAIVFLAGWFVGCQPGEDMAESEKLFIKMVDKTAGKLDLDENQRIQLEQLKMDIRKNFREGRKEKKDAAAKIKDEGMRDHPDNQKITSLLQGIIRSETERIKRGFDLMLNFQNNLTDAQKKKLTQMISTWVIQD